MAQATPHFTAIIRFTGGEGNFRPIQEQEVQAFIGDLLNNPVHFAQSVERYVDINAWRSSTNSSEIDCHRAL